MKHWHARGFSLLEVLVAFSILALSLGILMRIFSGSLNNVEVSHDQAQAVVLAQSLIAEAGITYPMFPGESAGVAGGIFNWIMRIRPFQDELAQAEQAIPVTPDNLNLWEIEVEVTWGEHAGHKGRSFTLSSLRAQPVGRP